MASLNQLAIVKQQRKTKARKLTFVWGLLIIPIVQFLIFYVVANVYSVVLSFQGKMGGWTVDNYVNFFKEFINGNDTEGHLYLNAILYSLMLGVNDVLLVFISLILAYFIYKKIPGRQIFRVVFFLPSIISIIIYVGVYKMLLDPIKGFPSILGFDLGFLTTGSVAQKFAVPLYCLWVGTGYNILVLGGAMANVPQEVLENGKLEGVSKFRELFQIIIPMIWPTLIVSFIGSITTVFTLFIQVKLITEGKGSTSTIAYIINNFTESNEINRASAVGIIFSLISTPIVLLFKKLLDKIGKRWGY